MEAEVASALLRWREVTAPLDLPTVTVASPSPATLLTYQPSSGDADETALAAPPPPPPCRAWNRADFLRRVASYSVASWRAKPLALSPLACARLGWYNAESELLRCEQCARVLSCRIDSKLSAKGAEAVAELFAQQLATTHETTCPWLRNASPESFATLPLWGPSQVAHALGKRAQALLDVASAQKETLQKALSEVDLTEEAVCTVTDATGLDSDALAATLKKRFSVAAGGERVVRHAALLSVCGWEASSYQSGAYATVTCELCNRTALLRRQPEAVCSSATDREDTTQESPDDPTLTPPLAKRQRLVAPSFDPLASHRWFCPWIVPQTRGDADADRIRAALALVSDHQSRSADESLVDFVALPGWKQSATALRHLNASSDKTSASNSASTTKPFDALASVQSVLALPDAYN